MQPESFITPDFMNAIENSPWLIALLVTSWFSYKIILALINHKKDE